MIVLLPKTNEEIISENTTYIGVFFKKTSNHRPSELLWISRLQYNSNLKIKFSFFIANNDLSKNEVLDIFCEKKQSYQLKKFSKLKKLIEREKSFFKKDEYNRLLSINNELTIIFDNILEIPWHILESVLELEKRLKKENVSIRIYSYYYGGYNNDIGNHRKIKKILINENIIKEDFFNPR